MVEAAAILTIVGRAKKEDLLRLITDGLSLVREPCSDEGHTSSNSELDQRRAMSASDPLSILFITVLAIAFP
ncbi:hypothetical protein CD58_18805 [Pseudomonas brassicacearum]|nr:hypothetical protein CD58_18805 [Pseudomonas brassicacearum]RON04655.1 hypothetical protein BK657_10710 [Pseudomonas brassicacearum]